MPDDNSNALTERDAQLLAREWIDNSIPKPRDGPDLYGYSQTRSLMDDLAKSCVAESLRNRESDDGLCERLSEAWNIIYSTWRAAAPEYATKRRRDEDDQPDEDEAKKIKDAQHVIWRRRDPYRSLSVKGIRSDYYTGFDVELLSYDVAKYLERPWLRHASVDWILVDMLVSRKLCVLGETIKQRLSPGKRERVLDAYHRFFMSKGRPARMTEIKWAELGTLLWERFLLVIGVPMGAIWAAFYFDYQRTGWVLAAIYALIILIYMIYLSIKLFGRGKRFVRHLSGTPDPRVKPFLLWDEMYEVWRRLEGPVVHPSRLREAMVRSTEHGAEWDTLTWSLVDRVVAIDPAVWVIWPSRN